MYTLCSYTGHYHTDHVSKLCLFVFVIRWQGSQEMPGGDFHQRYLRCGRPSMESLGLWQSVQSHSSGWIGAWHPEFRFDSTTKASIIQIDSFQILHQLLEVKKKKKKNPHGVSHWNSPSSYSCCWASRWVSGWSGCLTGRRFCLGQMAFVWSCWRQKFGASRLGMKMPFGNVFRLKSRP